MGHSNSPAIVTIGLRKVFTTSTGFWRRRYRSNTAVEGISFAVGTGELFGLVGPNGAGKTTTVKMLSTLLLPTSGKARILGMDLVKESGKVRHRIGFTFGGGRGLYTRLSGLDNLRYFAELYGLDPDYARRRIPELLELMGLAGRENDRVETYSNGMQQRLHLARVLLHDPDLIFLDEPTVGIDPVGSRAIRAIVKDLVEMGKTILLTTHYMYEAEELCHRIAVVNHGKIVAMDTPAGLKRMVSGDSIIEIQTTEDNTALLERLRNLDHHVSLHVKQQERKQLVSIRTREPGNVMELLAPYLAAQMIQNLEVRNPTLEDVYVNIIQEAERAG